MHTSSTKRAIKFIKNKFLRKILILTGYIKIKKKIKKK